MKKILCGSLLAFVIGCTGVNPSGAGRAQDVPVTLDSLERFHTGLRLSAAQYPYDSSCVRGLAVPMLAEDAPFVQSGYSFVRVVLGRSYEMCRYGDHAVLEIAQGGCEYFSFVFRWSYNGLPADISDRELYLRALEDTRNAGRWCGELSRDVTAGADTLFAHWQKGDIDVVGTEFDFLPPVEDFRYHVRLDTLARFSDAAAVSVSYTMGPL